LVFQGSNEKKQQQQGGGGGNRGRREKNYQKRLIPKKGIKFITGGFDYIEGCTHKGQGMEKRKNNVGGGVFVSGIREWGSLS